MQGQFPYLLHILGEAMPQFWFGTSDVLGMRTHLMSVHPATTPFLLRTMAGKYVTGTVWCVHVHFTNQYRVTSIQTLFLSGGM